MKIFLHRPSESIKIPNFIKIAPVKAELFNADRATDGHDKLMVAFRNFAIAPQNSHKNLSQCHFAHHKSCLPALLLGTQHTLQCNLGSRTPRFTNAPVHEPILRAKTVSDDEHASWQQRQADSIGAGVSVAG
jgi:hypothetical protein